MATAYGQRPSEILGLAPESWGAYQVDAAVLVAAREVEARRMPSGRGQKARSVEDVLRELEWEASQARAKPRETKGRRFRDPRSKGRIRKMRVPESGVW